MVVLSVLRRQLWWFYLFDSYGGGICYKATVMEVLSVQRRQIWWCCLF